MTANRGLIIINTQARNGDAKMRMITDILKNEGVASILKRFDDVKEIEAIIRKYRNGVDRIIVGGGDGT